MLASGIKRLGRTTRLLAAIAGASLIPWPGGTQPVAAQGSVFMVGAGLFDFSDGRDKAGALELQYRGPRLLWWLQPMIGVLATTDWAGYIYAGISLDLPLTERLILRPSLAPGLFTEGNGKDLGHTVEFRTGLELAWRFASGWRMGVEFYHLSNAELGGSNPGANNLMLTVAVPLGGR